MKTPAKQNRSVIRWVCSVWLMLHAFSVWPATAWDLISGHHLDPHSKAEREAIAHDLDSRIGRLVSLLADQNPKEIEKLERDEAKLVAAPVGDKSTTELQLSVAYQHRRLLKLLTEIRGALDCVMRSERDVDEMLCWARASVLLADEESLKLAVGILREHRRLPLDKDLPVRIRGPEVWYDSYARGILEFILIPYLSAAATPH